MKRESRGEVLKTLIKLVAQSEAQSHDQDLENPFVFLEGLIGC